MRTFEVVRQSISNMADKSARPEPLGTFSIEGDDQRLTELLLGNSGFRTIEAKAGTSFLMRQYANFGDVEYIVMREVK